VDVVDGSDGDDGGCELGTAEDPGAVVGAAVGDVVGVEPRTGSGDDVETVARGAAAGARRRADREAAGIRTSSDAQGAQGGAGAGVAWACTKGKHVSSK
jgi:uncharacterized protein YcfJ